MSAESRSRPSWQRDECPPWCVVEHHETDPPDDRVHDSVGTYVPATLRRTEASGGEPTELLVVLSRRCGEHDDWIFLGEPQRLGQHLTLSRESAARVTSTLASLLTD